LHLKQTELNFYFTYVIVGLGLFAFAALFALFGVYAERKVSAFIQDRLGPTETGKFGLLQTLADILKLIQKEWALPRCPGRRGWCHQKLI
jgi:NADH-quinone oxidoreductase subunit H